MRTWVVEQTKLDSIRKEPNTQHKHRCTRQHAACTQFAVIGTSDFETLAARDGRPPGLSVEAISDLQKRVKAHQGVRMVNAAVIGNEDLRASNTNVTMFLVPPDIIQQYRLPLWIKGCNEVGNRTTKQ